MQPKLGFDLFVWVWVWVWGWNQRECIVCGLRDELAWNNQEERRQVGERLRRTTAAHSMLLDEVPEWVWILR